MDGTESVERPCRGGRVRSSAHTASARRPVAFNSLGTLRPSTSPWVTMSLWINPRIFELSAEDFYGPAEAPPIRHEPALQENLPALADEKLPFHKYANDFSCPLSLTF